MKFIPIYLLTILLSGNFLSQKLNGNDLYLYAKEHSSKLRNSNLDILFAEQQIKETLSSGYPKINGSFGFQNFIDIPTTVVPANLFDPNASPNELAGVTFGTEYNATGELKLDQLLFSFTYIYGIKAAKTYRELSHLLNLKEHEDLYEQIQLGLGKIILAKKNKSIIEKNLKEVNLLIDKTKKLIDAGFIESVNVNELLIMKLDLELLNTEIINNKKVALINLKSTIGYPLDSNILLIDSFDIGDPTMDKITSNTFNSSAIKIAEQNLAFNELQLKAIKSEGYPSVFGFFRHQQMAMRNQFNFFDQNQNWYPATIWGLNVNIPIFNSGEGKSKTRQKEIIVEKSYNDLQEIKNQIVALEMMLENNYQTAIKRYLNYQKNWSFANELYKNEKKKYTAGASNLLLLSEKKTKLIQAEQDLLQKEFELYEAKIKLEKFIKPLKL